MFRPKDKKVFFTDCVFYAESRPSWGDALYEGRMPRTYMEALAEYQKGDVELVKLIARQYRLSRVLVDAERELRRELTVGEGLKDIIQ